ncbi:hypothetical protein B0H11DRAFT_2126774 [Mycena galericulata]|nr:hypothetical protein B0H11DRAFT_2126774 [Mycena galericulata]
MAGATVFQGVTYHLASGWSEDQRSELTCLLQSGDATLAESSREATHIIAASETFQEAEQVGPHAAVVSELWVRASVLAGRIQKPVFYSVSASKIFSGVVAFSADLSASDEEVVSAGVALLGGQWRMDLTVDVTHLFAVSTSTEEYATGISHREDNIKVIVPEWFDDCVLLHTRRPTEQYEWPDPEVRRSGQTLQSSPARMAPRAESKGAAVWRGQRILISSSLQLSETRQKIVEGWIRTGAGIPLRSTPEDEVQLIAECDIFVTRHNTGSFLQAQDAGKTIGNLSWLLRVLTTGIYSSPLECIMHYPVPSTVVEGFGNFQVCITGFGGECRDSLKTLIRSMGATFTPNLFCDSTILIASRLSGTKAKKAAQWGIPVVNHLWLEDCFRCWQTVDHTAAQYSSYPEDINVPGVEGTSAGNDGAGDLYSDREMTGVEQDADHSNGALLVLPITPATLALGGALLAPLPRVEKRVTVTPPSSPLSDAPPSPLSTAVRQLVTREEDEEDLTSDGEEGEKRLGAKAGPNAVPLSACTDIRLMITKIELEGEVLAALTTLGVKITTQASKCTHLITASLVRTEKFMGALAAGAFILSGHWAVESAAAGQLLGEDDFLLEDEGGEEKYDVNIRASMRRAKTMKGRLFNELTFYVTEKVAIDMALLRSVVLANGGKLETKFVPTRRTLCGHPNRVVISCREDAAIWNQLASEYKIYTVELVLMSALRQNINLEDDAFRVEGSAPLSS